MRLWEQLLFLLGVAACVTGHCAADVTRIGGVVSLDKSPRYADEYHRSGVRVDGDEDGKKWRRDVYEHTAGIQWCRSAYGCMSQTAGPIERTDFYTYRITKAGGVPNLRIVVGVYLGHAKRATLSASSNNQDWLVLDEYNVPKNAHKLRARLPASLWDSPEICVRITIHSLPHRARTGEKACFLYDVSIDLEEKRLVQDGSRFDFDAGLANVSVHGQARLDTHESHQGGTSLRLTATAATEATARLPVPRDPMGKDTVYVLTYWFKGDGKAAARVEVYSDRGKVYYRYWGDFRLGELLPAPTEWVGHKTHITLHLTRVKAVEIVLAARSARAGTVWFDAISLVPLSAAGSDLPPRPRVPGPSREEISARARRLVPDPQIHTLYSFARGQDMGLSRAPGWQPFGWERFARMLSIASYREHYADRLTPEGRLGVTLDRVRGSAIVPDHNFYLDRVPLEALDYQPQIRPMLARRSRDDPALLVFTHARKQWYKAVYESPLYPAYKKQEVLDAICRGALMFEVEPYGVNIPQMAGYHPLTAQAYAAWREQHGLRPKPDLHAFPDGDGRDYLLFCLQRGMKVYRELSRFVEGVEPRIIMTAPHSGLEKGGVYRAYHLRPFYDVLFSEIQLRGMPKKDWVPNWMGRYKCKLYEYLPPRYETISVYKPLLAASGGKPVVSMTYGFYGEYGRANVELYVAEALSQKCSMDIDTPFKRMHGPIRPNRKIEYVPFDRDQRAKLWTRVGDYFRFRKNHPELYGPSLARVAIVTAPSSWIQTAKGDEVHAIAVMGWCQAMMRNHVPFECITVYDVPGKLRDYAAFIVPSMKDLTDEEFRILQDHRDRLTFGGMEYGTCDGLGRPARRGDTTHPLPISKTDLGYDYYHYLDGWRTDRAASLEATVLRAIPASAHRLEIGPKDVFAQLMATRRATMLHLVNYAMAVRDLGVRLHTDSRPQTVTAHSPTAESRELRFSWSEGVLAFTVPRLQLYTVVECRRTGDPSAPRRSVDGGGK